MKRFIVAVATKYYDNAGTKVITRYYTAHASSKAVAAKRVMLNVDAGDKVWCKNNVFEYRYSRLIFAETLTERKIRALNKGFESCICDRIDARTKLSFGLITYDEYKAVDKMGDTFRAVLDAIEH